MPLRLLPIVRQTTAYDKSALRVRMNGRRQLTPDSELSKAQVIADAEALHITKPLVQTSKRKNWIAPDVYDFERIPERRGVILDDDDDNDDDYSDENELEPLMNEKSKKRARPEPKTYDGKRRRLNNADLSFISNPYASYTTVSEPSANLDPSTGLLKTIHHFASEFYDASGQMVNATRKTLSRKKSQELQQSEEPDTEDEKNTEDAEGTDTDGDNKRDSSESDSSKPDQGSDSDNAKGDSPPRNKRKSRYNRTKQRCIQKLQEKKDMYTAFDGSALFCIGMLLKAHIISQLESSVSDSWDSEVAAYQELKQDLHFHDSDKDSEGEKENSDNTDAEEQIREERSKRWENTALSSAGMKNRYKLDDLKVDFISPEYSRL
ncbi:hypothetical protein Clacol_001291 [Clathrus columnatus]|uniref:Uncharacterized protein n=1 Tax=Clathrus columnatus TaxID=1419009 RepID=A0AAV5A0Z9_9AGAM|nr:hypothetical protein Clacol_001291 [Clathrus columnatus]